MDKFGRRAYQIQSGESIVIVNDEQVFKYPLPGHRENLLHIASQDLVSTTGFLIPDKKLFLQTFFVYKRLKLPISVDKARENLKQLTMSVVIALKNLHDQGYTHCDIRLDNICYRGNRAVLIDLDMGGPICKPYIASSKTGSLMYPCFIKDREKLDWRQLAITIVHIEEPRSLASYHKKRTELQ